MTDVLSLLKELAARPSVTPDDAGCLDIVQAYLAPSGFEFERIDRGSVSNLWATHGDGAPLLCFAGHIDVVPPGPLDAWASDPFVPTERDGQLIARGVSDMKGSDAAMVVALAELARAGHPGTLALLLTSDEEGPGIFGTRLVLDTLKERGVKIDAAMVGEPTSERTFGDVVKVGRRGSMSGRLVVPGTQGHTAYPQLADNAVHRLAPALANLVALDFGPADANFPATTLQVSNLHAGTGADNVIPGSAELRFNLRFGTGKSVEELQSMVEGALLSGGVSAKPEWNVSALPFLTESELLLAALSQAVEAECGVAPGRSTGGGTSDARFFAAHGIPVAEFGPLNATIHAANEQIEIACLPRLVRIYRQAASHLLVSL